MQIADEPEPPPEDDSLGAILKNSKAALSVASAGIVLIVFEAYDGFYSRFHLQASDVGVGTTDLLAKSGIGLIFVAGFVGLIALLTALAWPPREERPGGRATEESSAAVRSAKSDRREVRRTDVRRPVRHALGALLILFCVAPAVAAFAAPGGFVEGWTVVALAGLCLLPFGIIGIVVARSTYRPLLAFVVAAVFVACSCVLAQQWGEYQANELLRGRSVDTTFGGGVIRFVAIPVCTQWIGPAVSGPDTVKHRLSGTLLGRNSQVVVVLRGTGANAHALFVPPGDVIVSTRSQRACSR